MAVGQLNFTPSFIIAFYFTIIYLMTSFPNFTSCIILPFHFISFNAIFNHFTSIFYHFFSYCLHSISCTAALLISLHGCYRVALPFILFHVMPCDIISIHALSLLFILSPAMPSQFHSIHCHCFSFYFL